MSERRDDREPISRDWLVDMGGEGETHMRHPTISFDVMSEGGYGSTWVRFTEPTIADDPWAVDLVHAPFDGSSVVVILLGGRNYATRRDARELFVGLGIETKEKP